MILVTLGTQDKSFERLLKEVEKNIKNKTIKEEVVVQAGYTKYESKYMKIFDYVSQNEMDSLVAKASFIISHAGVGSILTALSNEKKIIVAPRLSKYGEHNNDHQVEIAKEFEKMGHIIYLRKMSDLETTIKNIKKFEPKLLDHNNKVLELVEEFIDSI